MRWFAELLDKLFCIVPRLIMVGPDEAGIIVTLGKYIRVTPSGWYIFWPLIQNNAVAVVTPQVVDLRAQSIATPDGHNVTVSGAIEYEIRDIRRAMLNVQDLDRSLQNYALGVIAEHVATTEDAGSYKKFITDIRKTIRNHVNDWGIKVNSVYLTDDVRCRVIRLIGNSGIE